ncbi:YncE family protein [Terriglobus sp. TAA 43]|uniref:YncE family protein n=1 Tax=Terriglobus sp. TAA 43 TaxID=278961 RepID=UPI0012EE60A4|nr:YncE family protein [Terriglobus sp. TAA 43]
MTSRFCSIAGLAVVCVHALFAQGSTKDTATPVQHIRELKLPASINGNFDHLAVDVKRSRLFITAEDAKKVLILDLKSGAVAGSIPSPRPHDVLFRPDTDRLYVTDGGEGSLSIYDGESYKLIKRIGLEKDADAVGFDPSRKFMYIVNGGGDVGQKFSLLSIVDTVKAEKVQDLQINGDTLEAMSLDAYRPRIYVNDKATNEVVVLDRFRNVEVARWPLNACKTNVAMALDESRQRLFVGCLSGNVAVLDTNTGKQVTNLSIHAGVDDLIYEASTRRLYASADGSLDIYDQIDLDHYQNRGAQPTGAKARTAYLSTELNQLFVAVPKSETSGPHILVLQPTNTLPARSPLADLKEPVNAPVAEQIVLKELSAHQMLRRMGLHVIPPGQKTMILIANGNETRLGIHTSPGDFAAVKDGGIYGPRIDDGQFYNMKMSMFDAQHRNIGILVMEIPCTAAANEKEAAAQADSIRAEVASQIPDLQSLFATSSR